MPILAIITSNALRASQIVVRIPRNEGRRLFVPSEGKDRQNRLGDLHQKARFSPGVVVGGAMGSNWSHLKAPWRRVSGFDSRKQHHVNHLATIA